MLFRKRRRGRRPKKSPIQRFIKSFISIVILSAFVLGVALFVREVSSVDTYKLVSFTDPLLSKLGLSSKQVGDVAGIFIGRVLKTNIGPSKNYEYNFEEDNSIKTDLEVENREIKLRLALMADSHNNNEKLVLALDKAKEYDIHAVIFLGDYTDLGIKEKLIDAKKIMDSSGLLYYSIPGDRDYTLKIDEEASLDNFYEIFGQPPVILTLSGVNLVIVNNSANFTPMNDEYIGQVMKGIDLGDFVFMSQPLYHPLASYVKPVMGLVKGQEISDIKSQADDLLKRVRESDVKAIFSADHHAYSASIDPEKKDLEHYVIGPVTDVKSQQKMTSITILTIFADKTYSVEEIFF